MENMKKWYNGQRRVLTTYKGGKIDGKYEKWYNDGQRWELTTYKDGKLDGKYESCQYICRYIDYV